MKTYIGTKIIEAVPAIRKGCKVYEKDQPIAMGMVPDEEAIRSATRTATRALAPRPCLRKRTAPSTV